MGEPVRVSALLLERYHLGEVDGEERARVEEALGDDPSLAVSLAELDRSDREFRARRSFREGFPRQIRDLAPARSPPPRLPLWGKVAAAFALIFALSLLILRFPPRGKPEDRAKGGEHFPELRAYLREGGSGVIQLADQASLEAGDTVQLGYRLPPASGGEDHYGVIFSIDGRSSVTMHYPYGPEQSTRLVSGRAVVLDEAYALDDAPDYEVFFFVVGDEPLDPRRILYAAEQLAPRLGKNAEGALQQGAGFFRDYEVKVFTLRKE